MKKFLTWTIISALFGLMLPLGGCGDEVSFATQEQARATAIENAQYNANIYRNTYAPDLQIYMRGNSTISSKRITGDGWASIDLRTAGSTDVATKLKCSTVSGTIGCMTEADFKKRQEYADQDGHCNTDIPFPLPKIVK